jgi:glucosyl-3-phosphoglycerate synthase
MITVIIPVLNESERVGSIVQLVRNNPAVTEVIVIDDGSIDGSPEIAAAAGAQVVTSTMLGKGVSMEDGLRLATNEFLLYLDGDLAGLCPDLVDRMTQPLLMDEADFVKAKFSRAAGRVTMLTAKPLIQTYFPELAHFDQPLSGIMAARRSLLQKLRFENDYGVDAGLFIDAAKAGARLAQVDIGSLQHDSHPLEVLSDMATQVARAILDRAARYGRLRSSFIHDVEEAERLRKASTMESLARVQSAQRLVLIDMDGVLLDGRFITALAERTGKTGELAQFLDRFDFSADERTRKIAAIFAGVPRQVFQQTAREIPLMAGAVEAIVGLRKLGFKVGVVSDSFHVATAIVRRRVFADFSFGHLMQFRNGKATGKITFAPAMTHGNGCHEHAFCKANVLKHCVERIGISCKQVMAVGDGENDICMLKAAGLSVAFRPKSLAVGNSAQHIVMGPLSDLLTILEKPGTFKRNNRKRVAKAQHDHSTTLRIDELVCTTTVE